MPSLTGVKFRFLWLAREKKCLYLLPFSKPRPLVRLNFRPLKSPYAQAKIRRQVQS